MHRRIAVIVLAALACLTALLVEQGRDANPEAKKINIPAASAQ